MSQADENDGVDFRPFFDMVVGILFILLILVGALIFFQQANDDVATRAQDHAEQQRRRQQVGTFLVRLASSLRDHSVAAEADPVNNTVVLPLSAIVEMRAARSVPALKADAVSLLADAMALSVSCVSQPRHNPQACPDTDLLRLDSARVDLRLGPLGSGSAVSRPEAARLLRNLLSGQLLDDSLVLLRASNDAGEQVVTFADGLSSQTSAEPLGVSGDLTLKFSFAGMTE